MKDKGGDVPKIVVNARRKKNVTLGGVAYDASSPQSMVSEGPIFGAGFNHVTHKQYRAPGTANSWTWLNPAKAKRIASRFKLRQR